MRLGEWAISNLEGVEEEGRSECHALRFLKKGDVVSVATQSGTLTLPPTMPTSLITDVSSVNFPDFQGPYASIDDANSLRVLWDTFFMVYFPEVTQSEFDSTFPAPVTTDPNEVIQASDYYTNVFKLHYGNFKKSPPAAYDKNELNSNPTGISDSFRLDPLHRSTSSVAIPDSVNEWLGFIENEERVSPLLFDGADKRDLPLRSAVI